MPEAVDLLVRSARRGGRVVVFGDYDCDGIGALAILSTTLRRLGADAIPFVPHRLKDGYGLRPETLRRVLDEHAPEGIVTVDCGITAVDPIREAVARGVFVVVTDHHLPSEELPKGAVLLNPKIPGCPYPFKDLAGAGLAWKLSEALLRTDGARSGSRRAIRSGWLPSPKIAALSTIADMVPLTRREPRPDVLGPGRSGRAPLARPDGAPFALLGEGGEEPLRPRRRLPDRAAPQCVGAYRPRVSRAGAPHDDRRRPGGRPGRRDRGRQHRAPADAGRSSRSPSTPRRPSTSRTRSSSKGRDAQEEVAPRRPRDRRVEVAQALHRPVLLLSREEGRVGGSGRTCGRTPLYDRLAPVARRHDADFGGHHAAIGLSVPTAGFDAFRKEAKAAFAEARDDEEWSVVYEADTQLAAAEVTPALVEALSRLEPHGMGNSRPLFLLPALSWDGRGRPVGERGLRVSFQGDGVRLDAVGWSLGTIRGPAGGENGMSSPTSHTMPSSAGLR
ncbi:MAG: DHH family phosphoesterase [Holophagales bacterium]|nr:DHH family phosphoesterase [Holophagales bacterium]